MKASLLLENLLSSEGLDHDKIQALYDELPATAKVADFRNLLIQRNIMTYHEVMNIFLTQTLLPRSKNLLNTIEKKRSERVHFKPQKQRQKHHITPEDSFISQIQFAFETLTINIPKPDIESVTFSASDEKQALMLAIDLIDMGELSEAEIVLIETLESFHESLISINTLCYLYLCTEHYDQAEYWARKALDSQLRDTLTVEFLCLAEQGQNKHLMATSHYQKLIRLKKVKSDWYLLLAYSQERSQCVSEARENYAIYSRIGQDEALKEFSKRQLKELQNL